MGYGVWGMGYGVWGMGYRLRAMGYGLWAMGIAMGYRWAICYGLYMRPFSEVGLQL